MPSAVTGTSVIGNALNRFYNDDADDGEDDKEESDGRADKKRKRRRRKNKGGFRNIFARRSNISQKEKVSNELSNRKFPFSISAM